MVLIKFFKDTYLNFGFVLGFTKEYGTRLMPNLVRKILDRIFLLILVFWIELFSQENSYKY